MIIEIERFISTVQKGSFTKASKSLFLTQPALSLSVARLEKEVGAKLFKRVGRRLVLTKDGESVYQIGMQIIKLWVKAKDIKKRNLNNFSYSIGLYDNAALKLSKYFQKNLKSQKFEITIDRSASLMRDMQNGLFDICICVVKEDLFFERDVVVVKKFFEKLVPASGRLWKKEIKDIPFILYNSQSSTREYLDEVFIKHNIKPNTIVESTDPSFMKNLAIGGFGVALLPQNFIQQELKQKKLFIQKFPFDFKRKIGLFLNKDSNIKKEDRLIKEMITYLQD